MKNKPTARINHYSSQDRLIPVLYRQKTEHYTSLNPAKMYSIGNIKLPNETATQGESSSLQEFAVNESNDQSYTILQAASISASKPQENQRK
jgi:hypothetical protein